MSSFKDVVGHKNIIQYIENAVKTDKVSHAYILNGEKGSGKRLLANLFAMSLQCQNRDEDGDACGKCQSCKQAASNNQPDIIRVTHEKPNTISIDDIREQINNDIVIKPYSSKYKIYIVPDADMMSVQAQNALLKTIEEPPAYAVILLLTENAEILLPTIRSRCVMLKLRNIKAYIPEYPIGTAEECADMIAEFRPVARAVIALNDLKIISFGPRPLNFLACNAPIQQLYNLGVEIEENSELDLFEAFNKHAGDERIPAVVKEMEEELGAGNKKPEILEKLAQYELTLKDWIEEHRGYRKYVAIAGKCWPAFQTQFGFVPCYVNSRLTAQGIPVSCEVDIYGALSELIGTVVSEDAVTLLDINNNVPADMYKEEIEGKFPYTHKDTFMGFHCGNTPSEKLSFCEMKYQLIMARSLPEEVTQGTLEGDIAPGNITFFRLQSTADCKLRAYIAQGEVLPVATRSFGSIGVFAIPEMGRFYRHVLIEKNFPHHGAVAFGNHGKALFEVFKYIGVPVEEIGYNQPAGVRYPTENPWK